MTERVLDIGRPERRQSGQALITRNVSILMADAGDTRRTLAEVLGLTENGVGHKFTARSRWSVQEIDLLAEHYRVDPAFFLSEPEVGRGFRTD